MVYVVYRIIIKNACRVSALRLTSLLYSGGRAASGSSPMNFYRHDIIMVYSNRYRRTNVSVNFSHLRLKNRERLAA